MSKRKLDDVIAENVTTIKKNSLDSDEEDDEANEDNCNVMNKNDFVGMEDELVAPDGFMAFNMKEELEEGHFNKDKHYLWNKEKQIRDNWLDNIDWVQIKSGGAGSAKIKTNDERKGLADSDSSDEEPDFMFDPTSLYKQILEYLKPGETVSKALCRLGKGKKRMTTAERWKKKKEAKTTEVENDESSAQIIKLTELADELLIRTGNMDIYQENYEQIKKKIELSGKQSHPSKQEAELDMYADDFDTKEKAKLVVNDSGSGDGGKAKENAKKKASVSQKTAEEVTWELKWSQEEGAEINGPHTSQQMHAWAAEGYFKTGAWVRRSGQQGQFYSAARIDFELYL